MKEKELITAIAALIASAFMLSCGQNSRSARYASDDAQIGEADVDIELEESAKESLATSMAAIVSGDITRKFVRTAQLKFRVADAIAATYDVEMIAVTQGGFAVSSQLKNNIDRITTTSVSRDSTIETTYYTLESSIELKVPTINLDRALREISRNIEQLDYRDIQATDVTLDILRYSLARKREVRSAGRASQAIARASRNSSADNSMSPEELARNSEERADEALLSGLRLSDNVELASITVNLFQRQQLRREMLPREQNLGAYKPGFGTRIADAFSDGWAIMEVLILLIVKLWALIAIILLAYIVVKYAKKLKRKA